MMCLCLRSVDDLCRVLSQTCHLWSLLRRSVHEGLSPLASTNMYSECTSTLPVRIMVNVICAWAYHCVPQWHLHLGLQAFTVLGVLPWIRTLTMQPGLKTTRSSPPHPPSIQDAHLPCLSVLVATLPLLCSALSLLCSLVCAILPRVHSAPALPMVGGHLRSPVAVLLGGQMLCRCFQLILPPSLLCEFPFLP